MLAAADYTLIAVMILIAIGTVVSILMLTHVLTPLVLRHTRYNEVKHATYESGVEPFTDARRRFNVRFYLVAVLFLVFDVEIVFLYPWARLFRDVREADALRTVGDALPEKLAYANRMFDAGYGPWFLALSVAFFFGLLAVGFVYEWRKGIFRWD